MKVKKQGCIIINKKTKEIGLVYRIKHKDYSFPKGHLEKNETLKECAIRETEEETSVNPIIIKDEPVKVLSYVDSNNDDVEVYYFLALENGLTKRKIKENYKFFENKIKKGNNIVFLWNKRINVSKLDFYTIKKDMENIFDRAGLL